MNLRSVSRQAWLRLRDTGIRSLVRAGISFVFVALGRLYNRGLVRARHYRHRRRYGGSAPEPYGVIFIDPTEVERRIYPYVGNELSEYGTYIRDGNWDRSYTERTIQYLPDIPQHTQLVFPLEESLFFTTIRAWIEDDDEWKETDWYALDTQYKSVAKAEQRLDQIETLYEEIVSGNYLSQATLSNRNPHSRSVLRYALLPPAHFEVEVAIGRDGEIFFVDGKHRFSIAKYTEAERIPVRVVVRHEAWQELRQEIHDTKAVSELSSRARSHLSHPDMADLTDDGLTESE
ncbi:hypothetical protein [Haloarcula salinisoli]|uniref:ParB-like nuclease domain-containing protein n=1 Tax=Haloarcula salinisoli TaxID=2487746 RepID=A0A8J7YGN6_9EURY|nr:hypothetical protein [Halomicroarcula salinisoli]MBX0303033.1 hypothetical protein [Halomicroarcula salinisoli]